MLRGKRKWILLLVVGMIGAWWGYMAWNKTPASTETAISPSSGPLFSPMTTSSPPGDVTGDVLQAIISEVQGLVEAARSQEAELVEATAGMVILEHGMVSTQEESKAALDVSDGARIRLGPLTWFVLERSRATDQGLWARIRLGAGEIWLMLFQKGAIQIEIPLGEVAVRGSLMSVAYDPGTQTAYVTCLEGHCTLKNQAGTFTLTAGQAATITSVKQAPRIGKMSDADLQHWLDNNPEAKIALPTAQATMTAQPPAPTLTRPPTATPVPGGGGIPPQSGASSGGGASASGGHVPLPSLSCLQNGTDCYAYCSQLPTPQDCLDFLDALLQYGIDPNQFGACVGTSYSMAVAQKCADQLVGTGGSLPSLPSPPPQSSFSLDIRAPICMGDPTLSCTQYCGQSPMPQDCADFLAAMQQLGLDGSVCFSDPDPIGCVDRLLQTVEVTAPPPGP